MCSDMSSRRLIVSLTIVMLTQFFKKQLVPRAKTMTLAVFEMQLEELAEKRRLLNSGAKYPVLEHPHFTSESFPGAEDSINYHYRGTAALYLATYPKKKEGEFKLKRRSRQ